MLQTLIDTARAAEQTGAWDEALNGFEAALSRLPGGNGSAPLAADLLRWIGTVHRDRGEVEVAADVYETSLAIAELNELGERTASALNALAGVEQLRGRLEQASELYRRALAMADALGDARRGAMIEQNLGTLANIRGDLDEARRHFQEALHRFRDMDDEQGMAWVLHNLGMVDVDAGEWRTAEQCFDEAFGLADRVRDARTLANLEVNRADLYLKRRDFERARYHCDRAFELFGRLDSRPGMAETHKFYGVLYRETAKPHLSEMHFSLALEMARICEDRLLEAEVESERAHLFLSIVQYREALRCLNQAHRLFVEVGAQRESYGTEQRLGRVHEIYLEVARRWGQSVEARNPYTTGHHERVAGLVQRLGEALGFGPTDLIWLRIGALLHDVGKREVSETILSKPGPLTEEEWSEVRTHVVAGDRILAEMDFPRDIRVMVRGHHERWDGSGYPDRLREDQIPLAARILALADMYDALTSERSHRPALPPEEAVRIMAQEAGRSLDPGLFEIFRQIL